MPWQTSAVPVKAVWGVVLFILPLGGCLQATPLGTPAHEVGKAAAPAVVLALLDRGINPWHDAFALPVGMSSPPPVPAEAVPQTFRDRLAAEGLNAWNSLEKEKVYWFEGTRVLAVSLTQDIPPEALILFPNDPHVIYDDANHGTATASVAAEAAPNAWILMVETNQLSDPAYRWAAEQPWIDVISTSLGSLGHLPKTPQRDPYATALLEAVTQGKIVVSAGGNYADPNLLDGESSPPWVISIGGAEGDRHGITPFTSQPVDIVANFSWPGLAANDSDTDRYFGKGTSFSAPHVAAVLAQTVFELRWQTGHAGGITDGALVNASGLRLTNADFRSALNMSARYWNTTDYELKANVSQFPTFVAYEVTNPALPAVPGTPAGPWLQMGWGYVDESTTDVLKDLLAGRATPPDKTDAAAYMEALYEARAAVWDLRQG